MTGPAPMRNLRDAIGATVVAEWRRNSREIIRVALDRYASRETIDIRSWWQDSEGNWRPGRGGLTLAVKHLPALAEGIADALQRAHGRKPLARRSSGT